MTRLSKMHRRVNRAVKGPDVSHSPVSEWRAARDHIQALEELEFSEEMKALKGKRAGNCNVTACQRPHAYFYNNVTNAYYCLDCAIDIRPSGLNCDPPFDLFPGFETQAEELRVALNYTPERMRKILPPKYRKLYPD